MSKIKKILKMFTNKNYRITTLGRRGFYKNIPDDEYLKIVFKELTGGGSRFRKSSNI